MHDDPHTRSAYAADNPSNDAVDYTSDLDGPCHAVKSDDASVHTFDNDTRSLSAHGWFNFGRDRAQGRSGHYPTGTPRPRDPLDSTPQIRDLRAYFGHRGIIA
ncbi:hypothetical protein GCM10027268_11830 [Brachybacterium huguangmaarense]